MNALYNPRAEIPAEFINDGEILSTLEYADKNKNNPAIVNAAIARAREGHGLNHRDAAVLLDCEIPAANAEIISLAREIKQRIYGNRIVMFAPLYLSNYCVNGCVYCPYHVDNKNIRRVKLTQKEIAREVIALQNMGHKRLALETGEDPVNCPIEYVLQSIKTIYRIKHKNGKIRRVNVNIAATTEENYRALKHAQIGTYILFQETYHRPTYEKLHPVGAKSDYDYHTTAMDRAMSAGIDDVGCGVLFGLNLYRYDLVALLMHAEHLEAVFGVGTHTLSVPRICPADNVNLGDFKNSISDEIFAKIVAILRIAVPYTGIIVSTRESAHARANVLSLGVSQISGGSRTSVGGYAEKETAENNSAQFDVSDTRTLDEIVFWLLQNNYIPSFCTACYREGRTGDRFMALAKSGQIGNCCQPNAIITLQEYLYDYAKPATKTLGEKVIAAEMQKIPSEKVRTTAEKYLDELQNGKRDFRF